MRETIAVAVLAFLGLATAADPTPLRIMASSSEPSGAVKPSPVSIERFIWVYLPVPDEKNKDAYTGPVTWDIDGEEHITIFPVESGKSYPGFKYDPEEAKSGKPAKAQSYKAPESKSDVLMVYGYSTGLVNVAAWGVKDGKPVKLAVLTISVGGARPPPEPTPIDPVDPPKPDGTSPFKEPGFRVLMTFDSSNTTRTPSQNSVLYGKAVRDYLDAKCAKSPDGEISAKEYRIWPANSEITSARAVWKDAFALKKADDWILIGDGKTGYSGPLPKTVEECLTLLKKYGGE